MHHSRQAVLTHNSLVFSYTLIGMKNILLAWAMAAICTVSFAQQTAPARQQLNYKAELKQSGTDETRVGRIDSLLQSFVDEKKVSSVVAFVAKGGNVVYNKAFGYKDIENQIPATTADYYIKFSQTKAVTTVAFMTLVEKGLVAVDDPVSKYFPGIPDRVLISVNEDGTYQTRQAATPMTFAHLMSHSSGLNAGSVAKLRREQMQKEAAAAKEATGPGQRTGGTGSARYLKDDMIALAKYPLGFDPGSEWSYHISTNMLGYMVELISGKSLRDYIKSTILLPLGMNDTDWYYDSGALNRFVKAYSLIDGKLVPESNKYSEATISPVQTYAEGAIGLNGPIGDYAKFCQMLLNRGEYNGVRILKPETIDQMTKVNRLPAKNSGGKGFQFGLGFELYNSEKKPVPEVSNTAFAWGGLYGTEYIIDPENDMIALFYLNMPRREPLYPKFLSRAYQLFR